MAKFDYSASADLYPGRGRTRRSPLPYRRFDTAAEAIQFAMEELPAGQLKGSLLEVDEQRIIGTDIGALYLSDRYPLPRAAAAS